MGIQRTDQAEIADRRPPAEQEGMLPEMGIDFGKQLFVGRLDGRLHMRLRA